MLFLMAIAAAAVVSIVLWRAMNSASADVLRHEQPMRAQRGPLHPPRVSGPDDDPEFLRQLDEKVQRGDDPPA